MTYCGISINNAEGNLSPSALPPFSERPDFVEVDGMLCANSTGLQEKFAGNDTFIAIRELMPGHFIRRIRETGGTMLAGFRESFRNNLRLAHELDARWVSADFGINSAAGCKEEIAAVKEELLSFYGNLWTAGTRLLLDVRWPYNGMNSEEWNRNISFARSLLPFPNLGLAINAHVHEAGVQENFNSLLKFLDAWKLHDILVRFHYEPELGNSLSGKTVVPVYRVLASAPGTNAICACPLLKDMNLLPQEANNFFKLLRQ